MWNEKTKQLVAENKLAVIGVVQEQHAERARLYKQWKQYDFPIVQDSVTALGLSVVPVPILIDEPGYVLDSRPNTNQIEELVNQNCSVPTRAAPVLVAEQTTADWLTSNASNSDPIQSSIAVGDALLREGTAQPTTEAVKQYQNAAKQAELDGETQLMGLALFRMGVAYRRLFDFADTQDQDPELFAKAADAWTRSLSANPRQYIWRRRIQQYGPRQSKPYPFYDWVDQAIREISARGETPIELTVPLSGAEIAQPQRKFEAIATSFESPDPNGMIDRDLDGLVAHHATVVPQTILAGETVRVHLRFTPETGHWNNEAEELLVWIDRPKHGTVSNQRLVYPNAKEPSSEEVRTLEFEFKTNGDVTDEIELTGYALLYVCTNANGQCLFLRHDLSIPVKIKSNRN